MGQTSDPETLVIHQETTPCNNPEDFKQDLNFFNDVFKTTDFHMLINDLVVLSHVRNR
jgi:hypothetical protein